jgi:hypothetical protein
MSGVLRICLIVVAAACCGGAAHAQSARLPGGHCYEIIPAQGDAQPAILLDRCRGRTWQLVRSGTGDTASNVDFRWMPLGRDETSPPRRAASAQRTAAPKVPVDERRKCFTFDGRKFCE